MKILFFCPHWGSMNIPFTEFIAKANGAGYDGVELSLPPDKSEREEMIAVITDSDLMFIGQHWETVTTNFEDHKEQYVRRLYNLASGNPLLIDSQTGKDFFSFEQNMELIHAATAFSDETAS